MNSLSSPSPKRQSGPSELGALLMVGLIVLGVCVYFGLKNISQGERIVTEAEFMAQIIKNK